MSNTVMDLLQRKLKEQEDWLLGCLLWKWFVGDSRGENFILDKPSIRSVMQNNWLRR